ncbi:uncharacterized protein LOC116213546 [Punica granatum]|uniref:Uncharacterized protein LOC116213546 n=1 Tax=Punica granatum TaxID=22663 RepID=A0A6P8EG58_PUNGR|nr:uncharacterized protein LOC116213546 [Punica granatum]
MTATAPPPLSFLPFFFFFFTAVSPASATLRPPGQGQQRNPAVSGEPVREERILENGVPQKSRLLFRKVYCNVKLAPEDNEPEETLVSRFRREVVKAGVLQECKRRRFFETKREPKKRKTREAAAAKRYRSSKRRPQAKNSIQAKEGLRRRR